MNKKINYVNILMYLGFIFLYAPIIIMMIYSFNESKLVTLWSGFSFKWYAQLLEDRDLIIAAGNSITIAAATATCSMILGTLAGVALARFGSFKGRMLFSSMLSAPFVMPEVITGFSMLMLFVTIERLTGWTEGKGIITVIIAHTTVAIAYVAILVQGRLANFDNTIEEAALDLGCKPLKVFFVITLPLIAPALFAGWLLSFTLSFDDLVLSSFTSGPGSNTLPMLIYSKVRLGISPEINALATIIVGVVTIAAIITYWVMVKGDDIVIDDDN
jgi:putrescine transport system permease protein